MDLKKIGQPKLRQVQETDGNNSINKKLLRQNKSKANINIILISANEYKQYFSRLTFKLSAQKFNFTGCY